MNSAQVPTHLCIHFIKRAQNIQEVLNELIYIQKPPNSLNFFTILDKPTDMNRIFRQYIDKNSSTYTYLIGDLKNKTAVLIDTVLEQVQRDLTTIKEFEFEKIYLLSTHVHADHVTGNAQLKNELGTKAQSVISKYYPEARGDIKVGEDDEFTFGDLRLNFLYTPGHTAGCLSIVDHEQKRVFTGDALLIRGCGRTDFQGGSSDALYESVHGKLFKLSPEFAVYPAHDYNGRTSSTIGEEIKLNPRLSKSKDEFINIMDNLNLPYPKLMDVAVPRNLECGF